MRYRFSDADRERLGMTEEWVEFDVGQLMLDEAVALEESGYDVDEFLDDIRGYPVSRKGKPVMVDVLDDDGQPVIEDGKPKKIQKRRVPLKAMGAAMWIAARRVGSTVAFEDFTFNITDFRTEAQPEGKDDSPDPVSGS